jgi:hypothetical protein
MFDGVAMCPASSSRHGGDVIMKDLTLFSPKDLTLFSPVPTLRSKANQSWSVPVILNQLVGD